MFGFRNRIRALKIPEKCFCIVRAIIINEIDRQMMMWLLKLATAHRDVRETQRLGFAKGATDSQFRL